MHSQKLVKTVPAIPRFLRSHIASSFFFFFFFFLPRFWVQGCLHCKPKFFYLWQSGSDRLTSSHSTALLQNTETQHHQQKSSHDWNNPQWSELWTLRQAVKENSHSWGWGVGFGREGRKEGLYWVSFRPCFSRTRELKKASFLWFTTLQ